MTDILPAVAATDDDDPPALPPILDHTVRAIPDLTDEECYLAAILSDDTGLEFAEFAWADETSPDGCYRAYPYQWNWWRSRDPRQIDQAARAVGKALALDTPIPTPAGWTTMGALKVGDVVYDEQGKPTAVTDAFPVMVGRPCFDVVFDDGTTITADVDHRWFTWDKNARVGRRSPTVRTTGEIAATLRYGKENNHSIAVAEPLDAPHIDLPIPPYTLGAWLGDGSSYRAHLTAHAPDDVEILGHIGDDGFKVVRLTDEHQYALHYPHPVNHKTGTVGAHLVRLGVCPKRSGQPLISMKHIPPMYLRASATQRLALLQGLMDTDGHITKGAGRCEITLKSERLARDAYELLLTLGQKPYFEKRTAICNGVDAGPVYRVGFRPRNIQPFRLRRKAARVTPVAQDRRVAHRRIVDVRPVPSVPVRCIAVDSPNHLYLAGTGMVPTHNTERIIARVCVFWFNYSREELVLVAPEGTHMGSLTERIETKFTGSWILSNVIVPGRRGITRRPFKINFVNGTRVQGRLPQKTGLGVKGIHPVILEVDEAQDVSDATWKELPNVVRWEVPGAKWLIHGVSKGIRDEFFRKTQAGSGYTVHRITQMHRPNWSAELKAQLAKEYGGENTADYRRNVIGVHGDAMNRIFMLHMLMACTDEDEDSQLNQGEYVLREVKADNVEASAAATAGVRDSIELSTEEHVQALIDLVDGPDLEQHLIYTAPEAPSPARFWMGMDVGLISDPSEILVAVEYDPPKKERTADKNRKLAVPAEGVTMFKLLARIHLEGIPAPMQARLVMHLIDFYHPRAFSIDTGGQGLPVFQELQRLAGVSHSAVIAPPPDATAEQLREFEAQRRSAKRALTAIKGYNFSSKIVVEFDHKKLEELGPAAKIEEQIEKAGIKRYAKDFATDTLRLMVDSRRWRFPYDEQVINQLNAQAWGQSREPIDEYGNRRMTYSVTTDHILDAARFLALGWAQERIEKIIAVKPPPRRPQIAQFG